MLSNNHVRNLLLLFLGLQLGLSSCSQEKNGFVSKSFHNVTARYNAYFLAKERLNEIDLSIDKAQRYDYNNFLPYYPNYDSNATKSYDNDFSYIVAKAKLPINKHKNSNWVDDSYILIGQCKLYREKLDSAALVFKYTHTNATDDNDGHTALIYLMRTYMEQEEWDKAESVLKFLNDESLNEDNSRDFGLTKYEYYRHFRNINSMLESIEPAVADIKKRDDRSRARFIVGQLYQALGDNEEASRYYKKVLSRNPPYELAFNTRVNLVQVTDISDKNTLAKIDKYFNKLLVDLKNEEYQDRIYYEKARFELRQGNISMGLHYLHKSLHCKGRTPGQKTYSYLLSGQTYYYRVDSLPKVEKYTISKQFYDSTVSSMQEGFLNYDDIQTRQKILTNFVDQITIVYTQDSLLRLSELPEEELVVRLESIKKKKEEELKQEYERKQRALANANKTNNAVVTADPINSNFIFYDPVALESSAFKFKDIWGERPLEDNWRRASKDEEEGGGNLELLGDADSSQSQNDTVNVANNQAIEQADSVKFNVDISALRGDIPFDQNSKSVCLTKIEEAQYLLGKIYHFDLKETANGVKEFQSHINRFKASEHRPEILYMLYLICKDDPMCDANEYAAIEKQSYPNSIYTKLMENPNYVKDNEGRNKEVHNLYERAFDLYNRDQYVRSQRLIHQTILNYPQNDILDNLELLNAMTYAKTDQLNKYVYYLKKFTKDHNTSDLLPHAKTLLKRVNESVDVNSLVAIDDTNYVVQTDSNQYLIAKFHYDTISPEKAKSVFWEFNDTYYPLEKFKEFHIDFSDSTFLLSVRAFRNEDLRKEYMEKFKHFLDFRNHFENIKFEPYFITKRNYQILLNTKNLARFSEFEEKNK